MVICLHPRGTFALGARVDQLQHIHCSAVRLYLVVDTFCDVVRTDVDLARTELAGVAARCNALSFCVNGEHDHFLVIGF